MEDKFVVLFTSQSNGKFYFSVFFCLVSNYTFLAGFFLFNLNSVLGKLSTAKSTLT